MRKSAIAICMVVAFGGLSAATSASAGPTTTAGVDLRTAAGPTALPPPDSRFQKVTLNDRPGEPMDLAVLPDLRVLHTARTGEVRIHDPETGLNTLAATLDVYQHDEEGLQSVAIDPDFRHNKWVYLYYSPPLDTPVDDPATIGVNEGDAPFVGTRADWERFEGVIRLSRFKLRGNTLDLDTEQQIIDVPVDRGICCHVGGEIHFDADGNLYLSTGDDSNPFFSDGYTPIDERADHNPAFDAQRTAANTNDLRGKLLRIKPKLNGGYRIPPGNLFRPGARNTRPEIYAMGLRNPFRFAVNQENGDIYLADYSPDAQMANPDRGPAGHGKWMVISRPGNYGWPYCATAELPYVDYDFATGESGEEFSCTRPVNESPRNTGLTRLPQVVQPDVWYTYGPSALFPELETGGIGPMGGPAYEFDARDPSMFKWPRYYDGVPLFFEWTRDYIKEFRLDRAGLLSEIKPVVDSIATDNPMAMEFGPDGALYILEYGDGFFAENEEAQLARIDFVRGNYTPIPKVTASEPTVGLAPLTVSFSSAGTTDPDGDRLRYEWDFDADGQVDSTRRNPTFTYNENGVFDATLKVTDRTGRSAAASVVIIVGNTAPVVELTTDPAPGEPFAFGDTVSYEVTITDDTPVDCATVTVAYVLGHDQHGHPLSSTAGCSGTIPTFVDPGHEGADNLRAVFVASYTDDPVEEDVPPLSGSDTVELLPNPNL
jgi:glucose/arabinose dehydrogenase